MAKPCSSYFQIYLQPPHCCPRPLTMTVPSGTCASRAPSWTSPATPVAYSLLSTRVSSANFSAENPPGLPQRVLRAPCLYPLGVPPSWAGRAGGLGVPKAQRRVYLAVYTAGWKREGAPLPLPGSLTWWQLVDKHCRSLAPRLGITLSGDRGPVVPVVICLVLCSLSASFLGLTLSSTSAPWGRFPPIHDLPSYLCLRVCAWGRSWRGRAGGWTLQLDLGTPRLLTASPVLGMCLLPTLSHSGSRFQGRSPERAMQCWGHLDTLCDWACLCSLCWPGGHHSTWRRPD